MNCVTPKENLSRDLRETFQELQELREEIPERVYAWVTLMRALKFDVPFQVEIRDERPFVVTWEKQDDDENWGLYINGGAQVTSRTSIRFLRAILADIDIIEQAATQAAQDEIERFRVAEETP